jgi:hypothetical protein
VELEELAYTTALRALDKQEQVLGEVRSRTATLVAAASIAASLLARPAQHQVWWRAGALIAFVVAVAAALYVVLPKPRLVFSVDARTVYEDFYRWRHDRRELYRRLAYDLDHLWTRNDVALEHVFRALQIAVVALTVEIVLLVLSLADTVG